MPGHTFTADEVAHAVAEAARREFGLELPIADLTTQLRAIYHAGGLDATAGLEALVASGVPINLVTLADPDE